MGWFAHLRSGGHRVIARVVTAACECVAQIAAQISETFRGFGQPYSEAHVRIIADGCAGYFLRVTNRNGTHIVRRRGRPLACRSLVEARDVARRMRAVSVELEHRVAQDEMGGDAGFSRLRL